MKLHTFLVSIIITLIISAYTPFSSFLKEKSEKIYLPVFIELKSPVTDSLIVLLMFKTSFKKYKIETISEKAAVEIRDQEMNRVSYDYFKNSQTPSGSEGLEYASKNINYKVNDLHIKFTLDSISGTLQSFEWRNIGIPVKPIRDPQKKSWEKIDIENIKNLELQEFITAITDSIVSSGRLLYEN